MSAIWFIVLFLAWENGVEIDDASYLRFAIFYVRRLYFNAGQEEEMGRLIDEDDVKKMISDTFEKEKDVINSFWKRVR